MTRGEISPCTVDKDGVFRYTDTGDVWEPYIVIDVVDGKKSVPDESRMVIELLMNEVLFCNSRKYVEGISLSGETITSEYATLVMFVNVNDLFYHASDAECVSISELPRLYDMWKADRWGVVKWCAIKRRMRPLQRIIDAMKEDAVWDPVMEALPSA